MIRSEWTDEGIGTVPEVVFKVLCCRFKKKNRILTPGSSNNSVMPRFVCDKLRHVSCVVIVFLFCLKKTVSFVRAHPIDIELYYIILYYTIIPLYPSKLKRYKCRLKNTCEMRVRYRVFFYRLFVSSVRSRNSYSDRPLTWLRSKLE